MTATHGLGTYGDAAGTVSPLDHKMAHLGLVVKTAANTIRPGLFWDGSATVVSGKANMSYDVRAFAAVTSRSSTAGAVFLANDAVYNVVTGAAPGSNSRIDVVYVWQREFSLDGIDSEPVIGVEQGTSGAVPVEPSLAAYPGAIKLATIVVPAGVTATNSGTTITQTAPFTAVDGGVVPFRSTAEMTDWTTALTNQLARVGTDYYHWSGSGWLELLGDTGWIQPALGTGWSNVSGSEVKYRRLNGVVYMQGRATTTASTANAFTLPAGFRPSSQIIDFLEAANAETRSTVQTTGVVGQLSAAAATNVSFAGFGPFPADA